MSSINEKEYAFQNNNKGIALEELLKNDEFIQYIVNIYLPSDYMTYQTYQEKIQIVFSSTEEFTAAMDCFKLRGGAINKH